MDDDENEDDLGANWPIHEYKNGNAPAAILTTTIAARPNRGPPLDLADDGLVVPLKTMEDEPLE